LSNSNWNDVVIVVFIAAVGPGVKKVDYDHFKFWKIVFCCGRCYCLQMQVASCIGHRLYLISHNCVLLVAATTEITEVTTPTIETPSPGEEQRM